MADELWLGHYRTSAPSLAVAHGGARDLVVLGESSRVAPRRFCKGHEPCAKCHTRGMREHLAVGREIDQTDQRVVELARDRVSVSITVGDVAVNHFATMRLRVQKQT